MKRVAILYNSRSGSTAITRDDIEQLFAGQKTLKLEYFTISKGLKELTKRLKSKDFDYLVGTGGDGTVNLAAGLATKYDVALGVLPAGTLNHFAKDIGIPTDLAGAAKVIVKGNISLVDYCTVGDHVFVNNSSIGIYPEVVTKRDKLAPKIGKWPAALVVTISRLSKLKTTKLSFKLHDETIHIKTPMLFIGNNSYDLTQVGFSNRTSLTSHKLYIYGIRARTAGTVIGISILALFGLRLDKADVLGEIPGPFTIQSRKKNLKVAVDGEVITLATPLTYKMHPSGLFVIR